MEKNIKIRLSKKFSLYGEFSGSFSNPLFIMVHGLPGSMDEEFYISATRWFRGHGFSTFRFNLYGHQKDARQLMDCTLKIHAADLDAAICHFRKRGVKKIFVAGHSFGGPTIFSSTDQDFDGAVLWDPSYKISFSQKSYGFPGGKYLREVDAYLMKWGINVVIGKAMAKEVDSLRWNELTKNFTIPFKIILAGDGLLKGAKNYLKEGKVRMDLMTVRGATHYFNDRDGMRESVFKVSEDWFRRVIRPSSY